jgi:hypothetical protein
MEYSVKEYGLTVKEFDDYKFLHFFLFLYNLISDNLINCMN